MSEDRIRSALNTTLESLTLPEGTQHIRGKVRENIALSNNQRAIVVTDTISAFDFILGTIPFKGQVLNQVAAWWFGQIDGLVPHHLISTPDPAISVVRSVTPLPVEIVVRGYLTGTTATSAWHAYQHHNRMICGIEMPAGMRQHQAFDQPIITPTTKPAPGSGLHDEPISKEHILARGLVDPAVYEQAETYARTLFAFGQKKAAERGLILVDTKYEMGLTPDGELLVIDEIHTPDSSRYWIANTYQDRMEAGQAPDMLDKEFVRRGLVENGINIHADPTTYNGRAFLTEDLRIAAAKKYIELYERITGETFVFPEEINTKARVESVVKQLLAR